MRTRIIGVAVLASVLATCLFGGPLAVGALKYLLRKERSHLVRVANDVAITGTGGRVGGGRLGQLLLLTGARGASYRHFADVDAVLTAWHERQVAGHLQQLADVRDRAGSAEAVLTAYAGLSRHPHGSEAAARLHSGDHMAAARARLRAFLAELVAEGARAGQVRSDVPAEELPTTPWGRCPRPVGPRRRPLSVDSSR